MTREPTPWRTLLNTAFHIGVSPRDFWALSLREWRALASPQSVDVLTRQAFDELALLFPDQMNDNDQPLGFSD